MLPNMMEDDGQSQKDERWWTISERWKMMDNLREMKDDGKSQKDERWQTISGTGVHFTLTCSHHELTKDHLLKSAYGKIFRTFTRNAVNKSVWRKKDCSWLPLNKHAMNIWLSSLRIRALQSWRTGKHLHVLHVLRTHSTCSYPGYQDTTTYAALNWIYNSQLWFLITPSACGHCC